MKHRYLAWIMTAALAMSVLTLAGCGSSETEETKASAVESGSEAATDQKTDAKEAKTTEEQKDSDAKEAEAKTMYTLADVNMHKDANQDSDVELTVPVNAKVKVYDDSTEYYQIEYDGKKGYVYKEYLTESKDEAAQAEESAQSSAASQNSGSSYSGGSASGSSKSSGSGSSSGGSSSSDECLNGGLIN